MAKNKNKPKQMELNEIATTQDGRDITRGYVDALPILPPQDTVLQARGANYKIYEDLFRDWQVAATFQQRRLAVTSREWEVIPGGEKRQDQKAADFLREVLDHISFDRLTDKMLFGVFYGYAVAEVLWMRDGAQIAIDNIKVRKQRRFGFAPDQSLRLYTTKQPTGEALPERKFWSFNTGADNDDEPYGLGLAHWLYWPVFFKKNDIKFWLIFLEKFGMPTVKGTYPANAKEEERTRLLAALQAVQTDSGIIVPEGMIIELVEAGRRGTADYATMCESMDAAIAKVVLSQVMTVEAVGGQYKADVQNEVRKEVIKADADLVCQSFNRSVVTWLTEWNFPGAEIPRVWRSTDDPDDLNVRAERDHKIFEMGYKPTLKYIHDTYGGEWTDKPDTPPAPGAPGETGTGAEFSETGEPSAKDVADDYAEQLDEAAAQAMDGLIAPVRELIMKASSLEEIRDGVLDLYEKINTEDLGTIMQRALTAAELAGRFEVNEGN